MVRKTAIPVTRMRPREELLFGLVPEFEDPEAGLEGYDPSQRAEILEVIVEGPGDGMIQTVLIPDIEGPKGRR